MQNIMIIGANRGIGLALTKKYCEQGYKVWALCRSASDQLKQLDVTIVEDCEVTNLNKLQSIAHCLKETKFDVLIHNAGIWVDENLFEASEDDFSNLLNGFEVNSIAPLKVVRSFQSLLDSKAKLAFITSRMGSIEDNTSGGRYGYRMSKAALNAAGKSLSIDMPDHPIAVIHPGFVRTDMTNGNGLIDPPEAAEGIYKVIEKLDLSLSGNFWHSNGEKLPW